MMDQAKIDEARMDAAVRFFYEHGGYNYDPATETRDEGRARCAIEAAEAEAWADEQGVTFRWKDDWSIGDHMVEFDCYDDEGPETCEMCVAYLGDTMLASLGCIDDADDNYRRVIEADLAIEARAELQRMLVAAL